MRQRDLAGLETGGIPDVALRCERQPDGCLGLGVVWVGQKILFLAVAILGSLLDVGEECLGGFEDLGMRSA
jgi:hypothetical protein